jgi:hypothetical protein
MPRPIVTIVSDKIESFFIGWHVRNAQGLPGVPALTDAQREVLTLYEATANDPSLYLDMDFQPGVRRGPPHAHAPVRIGERIDHGDGRKGETRGSNSRVAAATVPANSYRHTPTEATVFDVRGGFVLNGTAGLLSRERPARFAKGSGRALRVSDEAANNVGCSSQPRRARTHDDRHSHRSIVSVPQQHFARRSQAKRNRIHAGAAGEVHPRSGRPHGCGDA